MVDWPKGEKEPRKYWLSTVPEDASLEDLVHLAEIRSRIDRDYQEMKSELGLGRYEGRSWLGFHHHGTLCIAAYAFLAAERARLSPPEPLAFLKPARLPPDSGRGAPLLRAERHVASSITTLRLGHARRLVQTLAYCPWCGADHQ